MKARFQVPKGQIDWIVGRLHVGTPDDQIRADIRKRVTGRATDSQARKCEEYAVKAHARNRQLYAAVMSGRF